MKLSDRSSSLFFLFLSIFILSHSLTYPFGTFRQPKAGFLPSIIGILLAIFSLVLFGSSLLKKNKKWAHFGGGLSELSITVTAMILYAVFLHSLGYLVCTFLMGVALFKGVEKQSWIITIIFSALYGVISYFGFKALGVYLPQGIINL